MKLSLLDFGFSLEEMLQNGVVQSSGWRIQQICSIAGCLLMWGWFWDAGIKSDPSHCIRACRSEGAVEAVTHESCRSWLVCCIVFILVPLAHGYSQPLLACTSKFTCDGIVQQLDNFKHIFVVDFFSIWLSSRLFFLMQNVGWWNVSWMSDVFCEMCAGIPACKFSDTVTWWVGHQCKFTGAGW